MHKTYNPFCPPPDQIFEVAATLSSIFLETDMNISTISVLEKLNLIQLKNAYWTKDNCHNRMKEICEYFNKVMSYDRRFVLLQYVNILFRFLKKRDPKPDELHELYVIQKLYSGGMFFPSIV